MTGTCYNSTASIVPTITADIAMIQDQSYPPLHDDAGTIAAPPGTSISAAATALTEVLAATSGELQPRPLTSFDVVPCNAVAAVIDAAALLQVVAAHDHFAPFVPHTEPADAPNQAIVLEQRSEGARLDGAAKAKDDDSHPSARPFASWPLSQTLHASLSMQLCVAANAQCAKALTAAPIPSTSGHGDHHDEDAVVAAAVSALAATDHHLGGSEAAGAWKAAFKASRDGAAGTACIATALALASSLVECGACGTDSPSSAAEPFRRLPIRDNLGRPVLNHAEPTAAAVALCYDNTIQGVEPVPRNAPVCGFSGPEYVFARPGSNDSEAQPPALPDASVVAHDFSRATSEFFARQQLSPPNPSYVIAQSHWGRGVLLPAITAATAARTAAVRKALTAVFACASRGATAAAAAAPMGTGADASDQVPAARAIATAARDAAHHARRWADTETALAQALQSLSPSVSSDSTVRRAAIATALAEVFEATWRITGPSSIIAVAGARSSGDVPEIAVALAALSAADALLSNVAAKIHSVGTVAALPSSTACEMEATTIAAAVVTRIVEPVGAWARTLQQALKTKWDSLNATVYFAAAVSADTLPPMDGDEGASTLSQLIRAAVPSDRAQLRATISNAAAELAAVAPSNVIAAASVFAAVLPEAKGWAVARARLAVSTHYGYALLKQREGARSTADRLLRSLVHSEVSIYALQYAVSVASVGSITLPNSGPQSVTWADKSGPMPIADFLCGVVCNGGLAPGGAAGEITTFGPGAGGSERPVPELTVNLIVTALSRRMSAADTRRHAALANVLAARRTLLGRIGDAGPLPAETRALESIATKQAKFDAAIAKATANASLIDTPLWALIDALHGSASATQHTAVRTDDAELVRPDGAGVWPLSDALAAISHMTPGQLACAASALVAQEHPFHEKLRHYTHMPMPHSAELWSENLRTHHVASALSSALSYYTALGTLQPVDGKDAAPLRAMSRALATAVRAFDILLEASEKEAGKLEALAAKLCKDAVSAAADGTEGIDTAAAVALLDSIPDVPQPAPKPAAKPVPKRGRAGKKHRTPTTSPSAHGSSSEEERAHAIQRAAAKAAKKPSAKKPAPKPKGKARKAAKAETSSSSEPSSSSEDSSSDDEDAPRAAAKKKPAPKPKAKAKKAAPKGKRGAAAKRQRSPAVEDDDATDTAAAEVTVNDNADVATPAPQHKAPPAAAPAAATTPSGATPRYSAKFTPPVASPAAPGGKVSEAKISASLMARLKKAQKQ